jgi:hypothetical protein
MINILWADLLHPGTERLAYWQDDLTVMGVKYGGSRTIKRKDRYSQF